ncbi:hypothetical protein D9756_005680 [Leucocoprinus leucothites]|uniref:Major facilitator superfamily (MFS) profile domain-containing protein n=1 Tax=Leucocoprinus leucothites TaxID=201217 RepID=A0A8H5D815_9AGAR|nr:hypothetical protein D9756_005680 [Leucoagaricus leucothites]
MPFPEDNNSQVTVKDLGVLEADEKGLGIITPDHSTCLKVPSVPYPDGGLRAWGVVLGGFLAQFCSYGRVSCLQRCGLGDVNPAISFICSFGVYQDFYTRIYMTEHSPSAISWIGSVASFLTISTGLVGGRLYDKGYCMHLLYGGTFLMMLSFFMLSFVKPNQYYAVFLTQGIGMGIGGGMTYVPSFAIVAQYFDKKRTMAMSIITAGVCLGSALLPFMINQLLAKPSLSFAFVTRIVTGFMTILLIVACILMRPRLPPSEKHANVADCLKRFSRDWAYIALIIGFTCFALGFFFPMFYLQLAAITHGLNETFAFYSLVILNGCGFIARILCGIIARKVSVINLAIGSAVVCGCITFAFVDIGSPASVVLVGVFYGSSAGIYAGTMAALVSLLTDNEAELGLRLGIAFAVSGLGELIGPPVTGALLTSEYHWWRPAVFAGVLVLAAAGCFTTVKLMARNRLQLV